MSEFASTRPSRTPHPAKLRTLLLAATVSIGACSSNGDGLPPEMGSSVTREIPAPDCDELLEARPVYIVATPLRESLTGAKGPAELQSWWTFLQQDVEYKLMSNGIPGATSRIEVSATVGPMLTQEEVTEAATIVTNAIGGGDIPPTGELTDSMLYNFVRDQEQESPDSSTPLGTLILRFQPMVTPQGCPVAT